MPRVRLGVVLLVPPPLAGEVDGLRRACGDARLDRVAPHVTLVPPVNVAAGAVGEALAVVRAAAAGAGAGALDLALGPPAAFHPASATLHLPVAGDGGRLAALRAALWQGPLARPVGRAFVPHVTLAEGIPAARAAAAVAALADYRVAVAVDRLHVLAERPGRVWEPVADVALGPPAVVGRGGVELTLHRSHRADPEAAALAGGPAPPVPAGGEPRVVTARRRGALAGVARGWVRDGEAELVEVAVAGEHRGVGVGRQLRLAFAAGD